MAILDPAMPTLAQQLDEFLRKVDGETGRRVEQIVREALALAGIAQEGRSASGWPKEYFERTAGALAGEELDRPPQGPIQDRETW
jgi:hypothetical protein